MLTYKVSTQHELNIITFIFENDEIICCPFLYKYTVVGVDILVKSSYLFICFLHGIAYWTVYEVCQFCISDYIRGEFTWVGFLRIRIAEAKLYYYGTILEAILQLDLGFYMGAVTKLLIFGKCLLSRKYTDYTNIKL